MTGSRGSTEGESQRGQLTFIHPCRGVSGDLVNDARHCFCLLNFWRQQSSNLQNLRLSMLPQTRARTATWGTPEAEAHSGDGAKH